MDARVPQWLAFLKSTQPKRVGHCQNVAELSARLAEKLHLNVQDAYVTGLLHDCAKGLPMAHQETLMQQWADIDVTDFPKLWHAPAGAVYARQHWDLPQPLLLGIARHAPAQPNMSLFEKVIYVADKIEPARNYANVGRLRALVWRDFEAGFLAVVADEASALLRHGHPLHPAMIQAWNQGVKE